MTWTKDMALEIIAAGYRAMSRKYHPDVGGKHEDMIALTATKEHLEQVLSGRSDHRADSSSYWAGQRDSARRAKERDEEAARRARESKSRSQYWNQQGPQGSPEDIPIEPYEHDQDYFQLVDVVIMALSEKAVKIKIPRVKAPQWLPKSQLHDEMLTESFSVGDVLTIIFTRWIATQKGWLK